MLRFVRPRRGHQPDAEALSAYLDGRLDAGITTGIAGHLSSCEICQARLAELRSLSAALGALPSVAAPRSFRLRQADVVDLGGASAAWRFAPAALSVAAVVALFVLIGLGSRSGGSGGSRAAAPVGAPNADRASASAAVGQLGAEGAQPSFYATPDSSQVVLTPPSAAQDSAGGIAPPERTAAGGPATPGPSEAAVQAAAPAPATAPDASPPADAASPAAATAASSAPEAFAGATGDDASKSLSANTPGGASQAQANGNAATESAGREQISASRRPDGSDGIDGLRIAEIALGVLAVVLGAIAVASWWMTRRTV